MLEPVLDLDITDLGGAARKLQICVGNITHPDSSGQVDLLAISCFPNDYLQTPASIVGQLGRQGVDIGKLARHKARDERGRWQTWVSHPIGPEAAFGRVVCFEYGHARDPAGVVANLFRAVSEFVLDSGQQEAGTLRVPLLGTGDQGADKSRMLEAIIHQAYAHLRGSLPVRKVQIVLHAGALGIHRLLIEAGATIEQVKSAWARTRLCVEPEFDYFVSYRRVDRSLVDRVVDSMKLRKPSLRVFLDQQVLSPGDYWKPELIGGICNASKFLCLVTDSYVDSGECIDEFHAALCCSRHRAGFLRPLLNLASRDVESLPLTFRQINFIDAACPPRKWNDVVDEVLST